ncbi:unnamed protein product [Rotaria sp. Silwood2]|nr:unnamed protein product [Rotaria sp. Silwood2]CAF3201502.1 unnamed protein product [Rotaria sp. Silwood2]CAF4327023.1 unnamed protein product [Rotaria sp. Silwood2]
MYNDQLACLGTIQHLKSKFSQGYTIDIKVRSTPNGTSMATIQNVQSFLLSQSQLHVETREIAHSTD